VEADLAQGADLLKTHRADATVNNVSALVDFMEKQPNAGIKIAAIYTPSAPWEIAEAAMFRKEDVELGAAVDEAIKAMIADGTLYGLASQFFGKEVADAISLYKK